MGDLAECEPGNPAGGPAERHLSWGEALAYAVGKFALGAVPAPVVALLLYFWAQADAGKAVVFTTLGVFAAVQLFGRVQDALADPIVGHLSDRHGSRFGRRLPWIALGTPIMLAAFVGLWYPIDNAPTLANAVWLTALLSIFWWGFTMVFAPYLSLLPEIEPGIPERIRLSGLSAFFEVAGTLFGLVAVGLIIDSANAAKFAVMPEAIAPEWGTFDLHGYHVMAWVVAGLGLASLLPVLLFVRERGDAAEKSVPFSFGEAVRLCARNRAFRVFVLADGFFRFGFNLVVASLVFVVRTLLHQTESLAGVLSGLPVIAAALLFVPCVLLAQRLGKKRVYLWALAGFALGLPLLATIPHAPFLGELLGPGLAERLGARAVEGPEDLIRTTHAVLVVLFISPSIAALYVLPQAILADIADADEAQTGYRREAMYNGTWAVVHKTAIGLSGVALFLLAFLDRVPGEDGSGLSLGVNALTAVGPVAGLCVGVAWWLFRRYPIRE